MSSRNKADPNDWAKKRKEAIDRAKQLREERKSGNVDLDENYTFKPQVNKRPQYLGKEDSLDALTGPAHSIDPSDIFEQPLPGARKADPNDIFQQPLGGGKGIPQNGNPLSPSGDALGHEIKRHPRGHGLENSSSGGQFRSKFMQQYQDADLNDYSKKPIPVPQTRSPPQQPSRNRDLHQDTVGPMSPEQEADNIFMNSLRGGNRSNGPAWNDDISSNPGIPPVPKKVSYRRRRSQAAGAAPPPPALPVSGTSRRTLPEWNSDTDGTIPDAFTAAESSRRGSGGGESNIGAAKNRLSLLKSKMHRSDSGSNLRSLSARPPSSDSGNGSGGAGIRNTSAGAEYSRGTVDKDKNVAGSRSHRPNAGYSYGYSHVDEENVSMSAASSDDPAAAASQRVRSGNAAAGSRRRGETGRGGGDERQQPPLHPPRRQRVARNDNGDEDYRLPSHGADGERFTEPVREHRQPSPTPFEVVDISSGEQLECPDCGRKFNPIPYEKHIKICAKVFLQKRKAFDSKKMRIADNPELLKIQKEKAKEERGAKKKKPDKGEDRPIGGDGKCGKWKEQSNAFREAMKHARLVAQAEKNGGPMPVMVASAPDSSLVPCPNCGRTFNERAAERHIPQCKNIKAQPKSLMRGTGGAGGRAGTGSLNKSKLSTAPTPVSRKR